MMTHLSARFDPGSGGSGGAIMANGSTLRPRGDNNASSASVSRNSIPNPELGAFACGETRSKIPLSMLSVSPCSSGSYISLGQITQASKYSHVRDGGALPPRGCQPLLVSQELAGLPGPTRHGYTDSGTQTPCVKNSHSSSSGAIASNIYQAAVNICPVPILASPSIRNSGTAPLADVASIRSILNSAWPCLGQDRTQTVPMIDFAQPKRVYELKVSFVPRDIAYGAHSMLVLVLSPPSTLRLLRSEQCMVKSEAIVIKWLGDVLLAGGSRRTKTSNSDADSECPTCGSGPISQKANIHDDLRKDMDLSNLLHSLSDHSQVDHSQATIEIGCAYSILSHLDRLSFLSSSRRLSRSERGQNEFQAGRLVRRLSYFSSSSGKFGPAISVLCSKAVAQSRASGRVDNPGGVNSWSLAFHAMLERILRDAEDMAVTIQYHTIRKHFRRLAHYLDQVTVPRLVILDSARCLSIVTERTEARQEGRLKHKTTLPDLLDDTDESDGGEKDWKSSQGAAPDVGMTDLRDWSECIFGDPLMAMVFSDKPSRDFLRGFHGRTRNGTDDDSDDGDDSDHASTGDDILEFDDEAHMRLLLYQCYHATVAVVKEFYQPLSGSTKREFAARRRLNAVLTRLNEVELVSKDAHMRPSGEMSPAKKARMEGR